MFKKILLFLKKTFECINIKNKYDKKTEEEFMRKLKKGMFKSDPFTIQENINKLIDKEQISENCKKKIKNHVDYQLWKVLVPKYRSHIAVM